MDKKELILIEKEALQESSTSQMEQNYEWREMKLLQE
eukprot:CAMPEP_0170568198 /NCGR_PEP_ID=MMETSP0211-20121228/81005_1 /TAXON_ID=311385 /ORGANISM="Pseudokeronopsis sp., Strain OXSARD2" /LENGTH=36 /DNA_ID= /DNA_START= /DNA_END= /DNA_ORIENTATION=